MKFKVSGEIVITRDHKEVRTEGKSPDKIHGGGSSSTSSVKMGNEEEEGSPVNSADGAGIAQITSTLKHIKANNDMHPSQSRPQLQVPRAEAPPRWVGELYLQLHQGTLTSQASIKKQNRQVRTQDTSTPFSLPFL